VKDAYHNSGDADADEASGLLWDLHEYRKNADYKLKSADHGQVVKAQISDKLARMICTLLHQAVANNKAAMQSEIRKWLDIQLGRRRA